MKTLLKNRRTYRNRIGTLDYMHDKKNEESEDGEGDNEINNSDNEGSNGGEGNDTDSWDDMYQADKEARLGEDEGEGGEDKGEKGGDNEDEDEDMNRVGISGRNGDEGGSEDGDGSNRKEGNSSCGVSGRKDDEGRNGKKRMNEENERDTRSKRTKIDVNGRRQAGAQPMKIAPPSRKKSGKK